jgi:3',5'-cyclic AMP phosphodiesterase CpdA
MRIAHLSDLHFSKLSFNPLQFFSKRWLGNLNLALHRKNQFEFGRLNSLPSLLKTLNVDLVLISGDLTTTSFSKEFRLAKKFTDEIQKEKIPVVELPGNHDQYTKSAYRRGTFYKFFPPEKPEKKPRVQVKELKNGWFLILLDTAIATNLLSSGGLFSESTEKLLEDALSKLPKNSSVILANHFPFFNPNGKRRGLKRGEALGSLLQRHPAIKLYLHGHTHRQVIADLRPSSFPLILDAGSASHRQQATWNLIDLHEKECEVHPYQWKNETGWQSDPTRRFKL